MIVVNFLSIKVMAKKKNSIVCNTNANSRYYVGGFEPLSILFKIAVKQYINGVKKWGKRIFSDRKSQKAQIADLEKKIKEKQRQKTKTQQQTIANTPTPSLSITPTPNPQGGKRICRSSRRNRRLTGGKFDPKRDIVDFLAGPLGWAAMGVRKKRERKIAELQKQLNS